MIRRVLKYLILLAIFLLMLFFTVVEGVSLYVQKKLEPVPVPERVDLPPIALDTLWVSLGEEKDIGNQPFTASTLLMGMGLGDLSGISPYFGVARLQLFKSRTRVLGGHSDMIGLAAWHSQNGDVRAMLQYILSNSYFGNGVYGAENAAFHFYGKSEETLTLSEWTVMIAVLKSPGRYKPVSGSDNGWLNKRSTWLFDRLQKNWPEKYQHEVFLFPDFSHLATVEEAYLRCLDGVQPGDQIMFEACREVRRKGVR